MFERARENVSPVFISYVSLLNSSVTFSLGTHIGDLHPHLSVPRAPAFSTAVYDDCPYFQDPRTAFLTIMTSLSLPSHPHPCIQHRLRRDYPTAFLISLRGRTRMTDGLTPTPPSAFVLSLRPSQQHSTKSNSTRPSQMAAAR
jgi:hypothetical protein